MGIGPELIILWTFISRLEAQLLKVDLNVAADQVSFKKTLASVPFLDAQETIYSFLFTIKVNCTQRYFDNNNQAINKRFLQKKTEKLDTKK